MIFTDEKGKIYEIPKERYSEFEVSAQRAAEINENIKKYSENSDEVSGYATVWDCTIPANDGSKFCYNSSNDNYYFMGKNGNVQNVTDRFKN